MKKKDLIFEGAGWSSTEHNNVGNCRIRTRIQNKDGRVIYLECTSLKKNNEFVGFVSHCFDNKDKRTNYTKDLKHIEKLKFKYSPLELIKFVNRELNCTFNNLIVDNINIKVHNTDKPLCIS